MKMNYTHPSYSGYFQAYMSIWPSLWTPCEALRMQKVLMPALFSLILFVSDATFDRLPENPDNPLKAIRDIIEKQSELIKKGQGILERIRVSMANGEQGVPCKEELVELQQEMFKMNIEKIFPIVGEITDQNEKKTDEENLCKRLLKAALSAAMLVSILQFAFFGNSKSKKL